MDFEVRMLYNMYNMSFYRVSGMWSLISAYTFAF